MSENINRFIIPSLRDFMNRRKAEIKSEINCVMIGTIQSFNATEQTATISLDFMRVLKGVEQDQKSGPVDRTVKYYPLVRCPVMILNGGGGYISFPIGVGDKCIVLFCDRDIDGWFSSGQTLPPNSGRVHDLSDGIALVGINSLLTSIDDYDDTNVKIKSPADLVLDILDVYTAPWQDYSLLSTVLGWSSFTAKNIYYVLRGKQLFVSFQISGESNATSISFTIPYIASDVVGFTFGGALTVGQDNGSYITGACRCYISNNSAIVGCDSNMAGGVWTNHGAKRVDGSFVLQIK